MSKKAQQITLEELEKLYELARIAPDPDKSQALLEELQKILECMQDLAAVDTEGVKPCNTVLESHTLPMREDREESTIDKEVWVENLSSRLGKMCKTPKVL